ncbi:MAG: 2OG-Fe(II) oxygenase [Brumimicrobium sp.]
MKEISASIISNLSELKGSGAFASVNTGKFIFPGLYVEGVGEIAFPFNKSQAKEVIKVAHKAPFGKGSETIIDANIRSAWEIDVNQFEFRNVEWQKFLKKAVKKAQNDLGLIDYTIEANLYKLLIYEKGDFFLPHKDSEKEKGMFGSLIINFPSDFSGGELIISHDGKQVVADFTAENNDYSIKYAAFYADCDHEVKELISGYRICVVYNLIQQAPGAKIELQSFNNSVNKLVKTFLKNRKVEPFIILLSHQYTPENFSYEALKLHDRYKADALIEAAEQMGFYAKLCLVTSFLEGIPAADSYDYDYYRYGNDDNVADAVMEEVIDETLSIEHWLNNKFPNLDNVNFEEKDLITSFELKDNEPIIKESTGYMGNYGPDLMHWYHYGAVVIWSPDYNANSFENQNLATKLEWIAYFNKERKVTIAEKNSVNSFISEGRLNYNNKFEKSPNFNVIADWIISQNDTTFFLNINKVQLLKLFVKIDTSYCIKMIKWLSEKEQSTFFNQLSENITLPVFEKFIDVSHEMLKKSDKNDLVTHYVTKLPEFIQHLEKVDNTKIGTNTISSLFWIATNVNFEDVNWSDRIGQSVQSQSDWKYIHKTLAPILVEEKNTSKLSLNWVSFCKGYLKERVNTKPEPPADWVRELPKTNDHTEVWEMLEDFMNSPEQQVYEYRRGKEYRQLFESAILNAKVDLKTETIKKGSPHTLKIIKTQDSYENKLRTWKKDRALLENLKTHFD